MKFFLAAIAVIYFPVVPVLAQYEVFDEKPKAKIGQIIIIGNDITQDRVIRNAIDLYPGQVLQYPAVRLAERNLADPEPPDWVEFLLYDHPSIKKRIALALSLSE